MAKPTAPRDNRPQNKDEEENNKKTITLDSNLKMILIVVLSMLLGGIIFLCLNYVLIDNLLGSKLQQQAQTEETDEDTSGEEEQVEKGIIVDLGDFVLNLADVDSKRYLKANVALELSKLPTDPDLSASQAPAEGGGHGGHNGLKDIVAQLGNSNNFYRLRIGIGHPGHRDLVSGFVLNKPAPAEREALDKALDEATDCIELLFKEGMVKATNRLNSFKI